MADLSSIIPSNIFYDAVYSELLRIGRALQSLLSELYRDIVCVDIEETSVSKYHMKYHHSMASCRLGLVAQLVERRTSKSKVAGSNPSRG